MSELINAFSAMYERGMNNALVVGNSDGIGLEITRSLLGNDYLVVGVSKRASPVTHKNYFHFVQDVTEVKYRHLLAKILLHCPDLNVCIYCVGIGDQLDLDNLSFETKVLETNLMAAAVTTEIVLSDMIRRDTGHFIGLSSVADVFTSADAPSYSASKAGLSRYWEGLSLALKGRKVKLTNVRFGFVDTKMAKGTFKPFMLSKERAASIVLGAIAHPRTRITKPTVVAILLRLLAHILPYHAS